MASLFPTGPTTLLRRWINVNDVDLTLQQRRVSSGLIHPHLRLHCWAFWRTFNHIGIKRSYLALFKVADTTLWYPRYDLVLTSHVISTDDWSYKIYLLLKDRRCWCLWRNHARVGNVANIYRWKIWHHMSIWMNEWFRCRDDSGGLGPSTLPLGHDGSPQY